MQGYLTGLQKLCMSSNKESCKGADLQAVAPALGHLTRLSHLDLFNYDIQVFNYHRSVLRVTTTMHACCDDPCTCIALC